MLKPTKLVLIFLFLFLFRWDFTNQLQEAQQQSLHVNDAVCHRHPPPAQPLRAVGIIASGWVCLE